MPFDRNAYDDLRKQSVTHATATETLSLLTSTESAEIMEALRELLLRQSCLRSPRLGTRETYHCHWNGTCNYLEINAAQRSGLVDGSDV